MKHQLLHGAGGAVLGRPGFEFGVMGQEQVGQIIGVFGIVLGAAGDESLTIFLEGDGVDGIERDPVIAFEKGNEMNGRLFQAEPDTGLGLFLPQLEQPFPERFGGGVNGLGPALAGGGVNQTEVGLFVGTVQADDQVIGMRCIHGFVVMGV